MRCFHSVKTAALHLLWVATIAATGCSSGDIPDRDFDTRVTAQGLLEADVFVVVNAVGDNDRNDDPAFEPSECDALRDWVAAGGALLLVTDHYPTGDAVALLAGRFGVELSRGVAEDSTQHEPSLDETSVVYSRDNGGLVQHAIVNGRDLSEQVRRVLTFTGEGARPAPAVGYLRLSATAVLRPPQPTVARQGRDVIVSVSYGDPQPAAGWSQGVAVEFAKGRVVVLGEAAMLSAQLHRRDRHPIGMNVAGYDNRQLALNIMHWLTRLV